MLSIDTIRMDRDYVLSSILSMLFDLPEEKTLFPSHYYTWYHRYPGAILKFLSEHNEWFNDERLIKAYNEEEWDSLFTMYDIMYYVRLALLTFQHASLQPEVIEAIADSASVSMKGCVRPLFQELSENIVLKALDKAKEYDIYKGSIRDDFLLELSAIAKEYEQMKSPYMLEHAWHMLHSDSKSEINGILNDLTFIFLTQTKTGKKAQITQFPYPL